MTRARGNKSVRTHEFYLIVNNTGNSTRFDFLDDASDEVTKPRSVNVNLRPTQVHLVLTRRFFLILKRAYESLFVTIHKTKKKFEAVKRKRQLPSSTRAFKCLNAYSKNKGKLIRGEFMGNNNPLINVLAWLILIYIGW